MSLSELLSHHSMPSDPVIYRFDKLESTNSTLKRLAAEGAAHGTMVTAQTQTQGRGRHGRQWVSPKGNLYVSLLWRPGRDQDEWGCLPLVAGVGLHRCIATMLNSSGVDAEPLSLKWPNDLLYNGAKLGGILCEADGDAVIVGLGLNLAWHPDDTPYPATSLEALGMQPCTPASVLKKLSPALNKAYAQWDLTGFAALRATWDSASIDVGTEIQVRLSGEQYSGSYAGVESDGSLRLRTEEGAVRQVRVGDVFPVVPALEAA